MSRWLRHGEQATEAVDVLDPRGGQATDPQPGDRCDDEAGRERGGEAVQWALRVAANPNRPLVLGEAGPRRLTDGRAAWPPRHWSTA